MKLLFIPSLASPRIPEYFVIPSELSLPEAGVRRGIRVTIILVWREIVRSHV
jgi:hypothetical protein